MKIYNINQSLINFSGQRQDRKKVAQLKQNNPYAINPINQRQIDSAINNLANTSGEENVNFLIDVAQNLQYGTNIDLGKTPYNDWQLKLNQAIKQSISISPDSVQKELTAKLQNMQQNHELSETERKILDARQAILDSVDFKQLEQIKNDNIRNLQRNLDYFVVSSEVPTEQKLYILDRLNYFMSPDYEINPQLSQRKTQALAEIVNDIVVDTPESKIPNIKAVNQKSHGMCGAISICRKALAYEDKVNFVDMILSELDSSPYMDIYDISKLGSNTKVPITKIDIDFDYALSKGYRIIDTSATYWMNVANASGSTNELTGRYVSFDKFDFDTFHDSNLLPDLDEEYVPQQDYYRSCVKAKKSLEKCKKYFIRRNASSKNIKANTEKSIQTLSKYNQILTESLLAISPNLSKEDLRIIIKDLKALEVDYSEKIKATKDYTKDFKYLPNESENSKIEKIKSLLAISIPNRNSEILEKEAPNILSILQAIKQEDSPTKSSAIARQINNARLLYNAAAAYRTEQITYLVVPEKLHSMLINLNLPDRETMISQNMEMLIKKLEQGKLNSKICEGLANSFGCENDPEVLIEALKENSKTLNYIMTELLDGLYQCCLAGNRRTYLQNSLEGIKYAIEKEDNKQLLEGIAENLNIKPEKKKVLELLDKYIKILKSKKCTEEQYITIFNKVGKKNQMEDCKDIIENLNHAMFEEGNEAVITGFNLLNGLPANAPKEETLKIYETLVVNFNQISQITSHLQKALEIRDENDNPLNTALPIEIAIKKLENAGEIVSTKDLAPLQTRFEKIDKALTSNNGETIRLKDLPPELTTFTDHEKEVLKSIKDNINKWYSTTTRALKIQYKYLQEPLDELHRNIGVKTGQEWVHTDGESGLSSNQEVRIIEHMTDRPYYVEDDTRHALRKIQDSPYSGISSTSVTNRERSGHAQYIVDIKPVEVKTENGTETKEAMFHDNTWGPSEHENVWFDENGLLRTDYGNNYGGNLGYITDDKYRTGKIIDNIVGQIGEELPSNIDSKQYKKITHRKSAESIKYPLFRNVITPGRYPDSEATIRKIRQNTLQKPTEYFDQLEEHAKSLSREEVLRTINKTKSLGENTYKTYLNYENRIWGNPPFDNGIVTREDYDRMSDKDDLKILLEKIATLRSYDAIPDHKIFYRKTSMNELQQIRKEIRLEARKNFDYSFAKHPDIAKYGVDSSREEIYKLLIDFQIDTHVKIPPSKINDYISSMSKIDKARFDGTLNTTIDLMSERFANYLSTHTVGFENKEQKIQDLTNKVRAILSTNMNFTLADLNSSLSDSDKMKNIIDWIDDTFNPATDEQFVQIFQNLQNMTLEEFKNRFDSKIDDKALGIKHLDGFEVLTKFRALDEKTENSLLNMIYYEDFGYNIEMSKTIPSYDYKKFKRVLHGARYQKNKRSFDDIYMDYYQSLMSLNLHKRKLRIKLDVFDRYNLLPGYPKIEFISQEETNKMVQDLYDGIMDNIEAIEAYKVQQESQEIIKSLYQYSQNLKDNEVITQTQKASINKRLRKFLKTNGNDITIQDAITRSKEIFNLDEGTTGKDYKDLISKIYQEISRYETTADGKTMSESISEAISEIKQRKRAFIMNTIEPKYQKTAYEKLNKWISAKTKGHDDADKYFAEFAELHRKHSLIEHPEKMLNEYLLLLAKPSKDDNTKAQISPEQLEQLEVANDDDKTKTQMSPEQLEQLEITKEVYKGNLYGLLFSANLLEMQDIIMDSAKEGNSNIVYQDFKNSKLELRNGMSVPLDSDIALSIILNPLFHEENLDTVLRFIEQYGLNERVVEMLTKNSDLKNAYKNIARIDSIYSSLNRQVKTINKILNELENIDNNPDYMEYIDNLEQSLLLEISKTNFRRTNKIVKEAFKTVRQNISEHPEHSKTAHLYLQIDALKMASMMLAKEEVDKLNGELMQLQNRQNIISRIKLYPESNAAKQRDNFFKEIEKLDNFAQKHIKSYPELEMATKLAENY